MDSPLKDGRRSIGEIADEGQLNLQRKTDTLKDVLRRLDVVEEWAFNHQERYEKDILRVLENFMESENFVVIIKRLLQHNEVKTAIYDLKNQIVGEIVSAIFQNRALWLFAAGVVLLLMGYDLKTIKDFLRALLA
jgi:polyhydroxyalkanoate synthesis regulator phasin